jgi:hypothetical protein
VFSPAIGHYQAIIMGQEPLERLYRIRNIGQGPLQSLQNQNWLPFRFREFREFRGCLENFNGDWSVVICGRPLGDSLAAYPSDAQSIFLRYSYISLYFWTWFLGFWHSSYKISSFGGTSPCQPPLSQAIWILEGLESRLSLCSESCWIKMKKFHWNVSVNSWHFVGNGGSNLSILNNVMHFVGPPSRLFITCICMYLSNRNCQLQVLIGESIQTRWIAWNHRKSFSASKCPYSRPQLLKHSAKWKTLAEIRQHQSLQNKNTAWSLPFKRPQQCLPIKYCKIIKVESVDACQVIESMARRPGPHCLRGRN